MNPVWTMLFAPLAAAAVIALFTVRSKGLSAVLAIGASLVSFGMALVVFHALAQERLVAVAPASITWLSIGRLTIEFGAVVDRLSILMMLVVTGVGSAIMIYSAGYMKDDRGYSRYFACMSLFLFSMLGVVVSNNFIQLFVFWELVGVSSYLLIGFWFERPAAAEAGKKAFLVNRIGDFGFMLGIVLVITRTGTAGFSELQNAWPLPGLSPAMITLIALLVFCGAVGKSAQFPLHVWLPDAMEGPTPVSALIHAATMVAAGVYLLCRVAWLILPSPMALQTIAWIGAITAVLTATIAIAQRDIKRILAYSTLSQLGYMVMAVGLGGTLQAMFHLTTHAFFKALLFLAAGSVIVALHHEQDIWKMGGLAKKMPVTFLLFLIGTLALAGIWPLSGFYSKDEILLLALDQNRALFVLAVLTAVLTAFYMGRAFGVTFLGRPRDERVGATARESPLIMVVPMIFLAILSVIGGWGSAVPDFLQPGELASHPSNAAWLLLLAPIVGFLLSAVIYWRPGASDEPVRKALGPIYRAIENKFYFDEIYLWMVRNIQEPVAAFCNLFDRWIVQRLVVGGLAAIAGLFGALVRILQNGNVRFYNFLLGLGVLIVVLLMLF